MSSVMWSVAEPPLSVLTPADDGVPQAVFTVTTKAAEVPLALPAASLAWAV